MATLGDLIKQSQKDYNYVFLYGKYKGKLITEIIEEDPGYILWASENIPSFNPTAEVLHEARNACE